MIIAPSIVTPVSFYRYQEQFVGFTEQDAAAIKDYTPQLFDRIPIIVEQVFDKLFQYQHLIKLFAKPQEGYSGPPPNDSDFDPTHPLISFRKKHFSKYLRTLFGGVYIPEDIALVMDQSARIHTAQFGSPEATCPPYEVAALMGYIATAFMDLAQQVQPTTEVRFGPAYMVRAIQKLLWIQNAFNSHIAAQIWPISKLDLEALRSILDSYRLARHVYSGVAESLFNRLPKEV